MISCVHLSAGDQSFYLSVSGGANLERLRPNLFVNNPEINVGAFGGIAGGYHFNVSNRVELELSYRYTKSHDLNYSNSLTTAIINYYYHLPLKYRFKPYLGFGLGYSHRYLTFNIEKFVPTTVDEGKFATQWIVGIGGEAGCNREIGIEYRYLDADNIFEDHSIGIKLTQHF
ncbi:MAG: porin family protein [Chlamydiales bacterium]|nr:porin family protein [Chlamydiia bacterium]MCP5507900.1 porin family protein [Chlamydiales bacterium]